MATTVEGGEPGLRAINQQTDTVHQLAYRHLRQILGLSRKSRDNRLQINAA